MSCIDFCDIGVELCIFITISFLFLWLKMPTIEVSLYDILGYIGERSRPLKEGEEVFKAGHVILCGLEALNTKKVTALCLQTSGLTSHPHEIRIELADDIKDWKYVCSCKAGMSGACKHIVATLIYVNRNTELEIVSCTDLTQQWGKEKKGLEETYKTVPIKKFCHPRTKRVKTSFQTSAGLDKEVFDLISTGVAESALTRFLSRQPHEAIRDFENVDPNSNSGSNRNFISEVEKIISNGEHSQFLKNIKTQIHVESYSLLPCCQTNLDLLKNSDVLEVATRYQQGTSTWSKERQLRITDGNLLIAPLNEDIRNMFFPCQATQQSTPKHSTNGTRSWTRSDILALIDTVKKHQQDFRSSTMKNDAVWKIISDTLEKNGKCFTNTQCKDKYKYLKGKYMKKKDNMSDRSSGAEVIKFEYFHEMDEFLGKCHNASPIALASNIKKHQAKCTTGTDTDECNVLGSDDDTDAGEPSVKKKKFTTKRKLPQKETPLKTYVKDLHEIANKREDNMEKRHKENLESRKEALNVIAEKMDDIIKIMANKSSSKDYNST